MNILNSKNRLQQFREKPFSTHKPDCHNLKSLLKVISGYLFELPENMKDWSYNAFCVENRIMIPDLKYNNVKI